MISVPESTYSKVRDSLNKAIAEKGVRINRRARQRILQDVLRAIDKSEERGVRQRAVAPISHRNYSDPTAIRALRNYLREHPEFEAKEIEDAQEEVTA